MSTFTVIGSPPPGFRLSVHQGAETLGGEELPLSDVLALGKPAVLNFWAGLCPPCRAEMPSFQRVYEENKEDFILLGIDVGPFTGLGTNEDGIRLLEQLGITYPTASVPDDQLVRDYRVMGMPTTLFITTDGTILRRWAGALNETTMEELVLELIGLSGASTVGESTPTLTPIRAAQAVPAVPAPTPTSAAQAVPAIPAPTPTPTAKSAQAIFADAKLDAAIREALGKAPGEYITAELLARLTELNAEDRGISDLSGLEDATNLTSLMLGGNQIIDISHLTSLTKLTTLRLGGNQISDVSTLASLTNLTWLDLERNQVRDISTLASLTNLTTLGLGGSQISDVTPLASLTNLTSLELWDNEISDISPLLANSGLGKGDEVRLENNNLDLSEGSEDLENIRLLEARGVEVQY